MWLSEKTARADAERERPARIAKITIGGDRAAAVDGGESRGLAVSSVGGYEWKPAAGQNALILSCADGTNLVAGVVRETEGGELDSGEVRISSGGASVTLKNDGRILVDGDVSLTGSLAVTGSVAVVGSMTLNGWPVAVVSL